MCESVQGGGGGGGGGGEKIVVRIMSKQSEERMV